MFRTSCRDADDAKLHRAHGTKTHFAPRDDQPYARGRPGPPLSSSPCGRRVAACRTRAPLGCRAVSDRPPRRGRCAPSTTRRVARRGSGSGASWFDSDHDKRQGETSGVCRAVPAGSVRPPGRLGKRFVSRSRQSGRTQPACARPAHAKRALCSRRPVGRRRG